MKKTIKTCSVEKLFELVERKGEYSTSWQATMDKERFVFRFARMTDLFPVLVGIGYESCIRYDVHVEMSFRTQDYSLFFSIPVQDIPDKYMSEAANA